MKIFSKFAVVMAIIGMVFMAGCSNKEKEIGNAVASGNTAKVQNLLDQGVSPNSKAEDGKTLLMLAAYFGHTDIAKLLIYKGVDVNAKDQDGKTALMYAAEKGHIEVAKLLLENGADLNAAANNGKTALQIARDNNQTAMVDLLSNWGKTAPTVTVTPAPETPAPPTQNAITSLNEKLASIFFDFDRSEIRADQIKALDNNLAILKAHPELYVIMGAHADERGSRDYNIELSARRAVSVKEYLTKAGVAGDHFIVYAYGKDHPLKKGHDEASMGHNRRVDILIWDTKLSSDQVLAETIK